MGRGREVARNMKREPSKHGNAELGSSKEARFETRLQEKRRLHHQMFSSKLPYHLNVILILVSKRNRKVSWESMTIWERN